MSKAKALQAAQQYREPDIFMLGYAAGLADGQRKERRALKRWLTNHDWDHLLDWLASRAKRRRKG